MMSHILLRPVLVSALLLLAALGGTRSLYAGSATWKATPASGDWNTAANWTPATVPNGMSDVATFSSSDITNVTCSASTEVGSIVFDADASAFTVTPPHDDAINLYGAGIVNNSGAMQTFIVPGGDFFSLDNGATVGNLIQFDAQGSDQSGYILFEGNSSAGEGSYTAEGGVQAYTAGGEIDVRDSAIPASGNFTIRGGSVENAFGGVFSDDASTAAEIDGTYLVDGGSASGAIGGSLLFSTASALTVDGHFTVNGGSAAGAYGGVLQFNPGPGTQGHGSFTANGGSAGAVSGGQMTWVRHSPADGTFTANGGHGSNAPGGTLNFNAMGYVSGKISAHGGTNGGAGASILFISGDDDDAQPPATGELATLRVFGNGSFDQSEWFIGSHILGSIAGDGLIFLGGYPLSVGQNNLNTTFSGVIQDGGAIGGTGGSIIKVGEGDLTLSGSNTYTGGTVVLGGRLLIGNIGDKTSSATGTGAIRVNEGTLGGAGRVVGPVTVATATKIGRLAPGSGRDLSLDARAGLAIEKSLLFKAMGVCQVSLNSTTNTIIPIAAHGITIIQGATITFADFGSGTLLPGTVLTVINNTASTPIAGVFVNLADGAVVSINGNNFQANYEGGDGNDLTLNVVP